MTRTGRSPLTVRRSPTGFVVYDPTLFRLAGIGALPLPFTPEASCDEVLAHLRRLSPHRPVLFDDSLPPDTLDDNASLHPQTSAARPQVGNASDIPLRS